MVHDLFRIYYLISMKNVSSTLDRARIYLVSLICYVINLVIYCPTYFIIVIDLYLHLSTVFIIVRRKEQSYKQYLTMVHIITILYIYNWSIF